MKIATLAFATSTQTLGLHVVTNSIRRQLPNAKIVGANHQTIHEADYLLVSLYWWRDFFEYAWWLHQLGLDTRKEKPVIIIGGLAAQNPRPLTGMFDYAVIGDGEACIVPLLEALESDADPYAVPGVWHPTEPCEMAYEPEIPNDLYVENRKSEITRIEIARGCQSACPFCQLAFTKPYREMPLEDISRLLKESPTRTISAFAPNRCAHSQIHEIDALIAEAGLHNMGSDTRLDQIKEFKQLDCVRFGLEGFAEKTRKLFGKVTTDEKLIDGLLYLSNHLLNLRGKPMRSVTMYMIGDLPGEGRPEIEEFWRTMQRLDEKLERKLTIFLSTSSFIPAPFTPMERCATHPYTDFNAIFQETRPRLQNVVIATRGAVAPAPARIAQLLTVRGTEETQLAVMWIATKGQTYFKGSGADAVRCGRIIEKAINQTGFDAADLYRDLPDDYELPWWNQKRARKGYRWKGRNLMKDEGEAC